MFLLHILVEVLLYLMMAHAIETQNAIHTCHIFGSMYEYICKQLIRNQVKLFTSENSFTHSTIFVVIY